jgi:hypothetical protein
MVALSALSQVARLAGGLAVAFASFTSRFYEFKRQTAGRVPADSNYVRDNSCAVARHIFLLYSPQEGKHI